MKGEGWESYFNRLSRLPKHSSSDSTITPEENSGLQGTTPDYQPACGTQIPPVFGGKIPL